MVVIGGGCSLSAFYLFRLASEPQVKWTGRDKAHLWAEDLKPKHSKVRARVGIYFFLNKFNVL